MSKTWYPTINYSSCTECGACIGKCSHGVYTAQEDRPVVSNPEGCVQGCHGCGNICPSGSIEYIGENTDWLPPALKTQPETDGPCCTESLTRSDSCGCGSC